MAGLKKKKKEKSSNPNVILVVFLVLFVLTSIGLGVWGYYGYAGQDALRTDKRRADIAAKTEKTTAQYYAMQAADYRTAMFGADAVVGDERTELDGNRTSFNQPNGPFKDEKTKEAVKKTMDDLRKSLGTAANNTDYDKNFKKELEDARAKINDIEGKTKAEIDKHEKTKELLAALQKDQQKAYETIKAQIEKENAAALAKFKDVTEEAKKIFESNIKLNDELAKQGEEKSKLQEEYEKQLKAKDRLITVLQADIKENLGLGIGKGGAGGGGGGGMPRGDAFPLMLDVSTGKPLWDVPVGKIIRVDLDLRQVTINLGSSHGAKPELTFNVFGPDISGRAEKAMKGTVEIIKVLDTSSSQCRITSLYDSEGVEILMNLNTRGRIARETEAPIKEGDLLFNLFWGTRVAVAGYVSVTGEKVENPAQQFSQMHDFMDLCKRNGMIVDAYVDLRTGKIEGKINAKTRFLIRGDDLVRPGSKERPMMKKEDDEKDKEMADKKDEPGKDAGLADRIDQVNRSGLQLRNTAKEKGLLLISAENFANVIGYRKARSANSVELSKFRPQLPYAGAPEGGVLMPQRPPEKKEEAPKDMEKKDKDAGN